MPTLSHALLVMALAATPVSELRGAIPLALFQFKFEPWSALGLAVVGNLLPVPFLLLGLGKARLLAQRVPSLQRILTWWMDRTTRQHAGKFERFGAVVLVAFVAIPFPATGAWTASLAAVLFGVPFRQAFGLIALGVVVAGGVVTLASLGVLSLGK